MEGTTVGKSCPDDFPLSEVKRKKGENHLDTEQTCEPGGARPYKYLFFFKKQVLIGVRPNLLIYTTT